MQKRKIGIHAAGFIGWGGGIDFLRMIIRGILSTKKYEVIVLLPDRLTFKDKIKRSLSRFSLTANKNTPRQFSDQRNLFREFSPEAVSISYKKSLKNAVKRHHIDLLIPCIEVVNPDIDIPWVGYIYDFQHEYLTQFFTPEEIKHRQIQFGNTVHTAKNVIVNSYAVKKDIEKFYPDSIAKVTNLPFTPLFNRQLLSSNFTEIKNRYALPDKYFIISNQFWIHKSHITAFRALQILHSISNERVAIVCTGDTGDSRRADYFDSLKKEIRDLGIEDKIFFLGYISKPDQIQLLLHSVALIQPTLFEGGPGGGATYDAIAFSKPAIISDIDINKEINDPLVTFFQVNNHADLADKMKAVLEQHKSSHWQLDADKLEEETAQRIRILGDVLSALIDAI
ncbi:MULTISPECIES: glycosyltransferase [unclassified Chitinophaga]|uniref:glycosyltransferase n=1 Tax=unclassified Chitinophaga TaxID=2619133 RepID=UPI0030100B82